MKQQKLFPWRGIERVVDWIGTKNKADKSIPQGGDYLLKKDVWCELTEIQGHDPDVLYSVTMEKAFQNIITTHTMHHRIALFSLCTATRPYSVSRKWSTYLKEFEKDCDLIIHSNGGIIPIEYEGQFPYLNYDAHGEKKYDKIYIEVGIRRMKEFLSRHPYQFILFNYRHNMRNVKIAEAVGPWAVKSGFTQEYAILPTKAHYERAQKEGFADAGYKMYPELWPSILNEVKQQIEDWKKCSL